MSLSEKLANVRGLRVPLGSSLEFPPRVDPSTHELAVVVEEACVVQAVRDLIETKIGEVPGHEDEGTSSGGDLEPEPGVLDMRPHEIVAALSAYEKRVTQVKAAARVVDVAGGHSTVLTRVTWKYRATGEPGSTQLEKYLDSTGVDNGGN